MKDIQQFISRNMSNINASEIRKVFDLAGKIQDPVDLSIGQPDYPVPEAVKESLVAAISRNQNSYTPTQGILPLREALAEKLLTENKFSVSPGNVIVSAGVASLIFFAFQSIFNEGDDVLLVDPYFLIYEGLARYHKLNIHFLPENFTPDAANEWAENKKIRLKAVIYSNPSNPTGKVFTRDELESLARIARAHDALVIADELYEKLVYEGSHISMAEIFPENLLLFNGFSKSHAMTGLRVGYAAASEKNAALINNMATLQQYSVVCSPQPAQWAAITALKTPLEKEFQIMKKRNQMVKDAMKGVTEFTSPNGAFYIFPTVPVNGMDFVKRAIEEKLLLVPGYIFSQNAHTVRISYAQKEDILVRGLNIFKELIQSFRK